MTMDLWYDLAAREIPDLDEALIAKLQGTDAVRLVEDEPEPVATPVDFY
jgi:hypothetical protein